MAKKRKLKKVTRSIVTYLTIILFVVVVAGVSVYRIVDLKLEQNQLLAEQEALTQQKEKLKEQLENVNDPEYIEQEAREQLKLIMPGETLYILQDESQGDEDGSDEEGN